MFLIPMIGDERIAPDAQSDPELHPLSSYFRLKLPNGFVLQ